VEGRTLLVNRGDAAEARLGHIHTFAKQKSEGHSMRIAVGLLCISVGVIAGSCAGSKADEGAAATISGTVVMIGNDPFTAVALSSDPSTTYRLEAEAKVLLELGKIQGRTIEVSGKVRRTVQGLVLKIEKYVVH
jgi:hypothetical protein